MKSLSIKKLSILGLVLIAASAVTAAVLPKTESKSSDSNGRLQDTTNDGGRLVTCKPGGSGVVCNITDGTATSANDPNGVTSTSGDDQTTSFEQNTTA